MSFKVPSNLNLNETMKSEQRILKERKGISVMHAVSIRCQQEGGVLENLIPIYVPYIA